MLLKLILNYKNLEILTQNEIKIEEAPFIRNVKDG